MDPLKLIANNLFSLSAVTLILTLKLINCGRSLRQVGSMARELEAGELSVEAGVTQHTRGHGGLSRWQTPPHPALDLNTGESHAIKIQLQATGMKCGSQCNEKLAS